MRTAQSIAEMGELVTSGRVGPCDIDECHEVATSYGLVEHGLGINVWLFCGRHYDEYLEILDLLERRRNETQASTRH